MKHVLIVGAGVLGASIAYRVARAGARVTIVDRIGPSAGASGQSFGWLNASFYHDDAHHRLRAEGLAAFQRLHADLPELGIQWRSAIWYEAQGPGLWDMRDRLVALDYPVTYLDRSALCDRVPGWVAPEAALEFSSEGVAEGAVLTGGLIAAAQKLGVQAVWGVTVKALLQPHGRVIGVETDAGHIYADEVIVAAGVGAAQLLGLPMKHRPGLLMTSQPLPQILPHVLVSPEGEIRQDSQGRFVMPTAVAHQADETEVLTASVTDLANAALVRLQAQFPGVPLIWQTVTHALRPVPQDGLPVIGALGPGAFVAVMHSGMTLAAITGEYVAQEVLGSDFVDALGPYRPQRFGL